MSNSAVLFTAVSGDTNTTALKPGNDNFHVSTAEGDTTNLSNALSGPTLRSSTWLYVFFRGSKLSLGLAYHPQSLPKEWSFWIDGRDSGFTTSNVSTGDSSASVATAKFLLEIQPSASTELTDHQLVAYIPAAKDRPLQVEMGVDNNARNATPATYGMSGTEVQANGALDDTSPSLVYSAGWSHSTGSFWDALCWNETSSKTNQGGAWVGDDFCWNRFFGYTGTDDVHLNISVTDHVGDQKGVRWKEHLIKGDPQMKVALVQAPLFNETNLPTTVARTYRIMVISGSITLDFVRFQGEIVNAPTAHQYSRRDMILIATLSSLGALMLGVLLYILLKRRRPRKEQMVGRSVGPDAPTIRSFYAASTNTAVSGRIHRKRAEDDRAEWMTFSSLQSLSRSTEGSSAGLHSPVEYPFPSSHLPSESHTLHSLDPRRSSISFLGVDGLRGVTGSGPLDLRDLQLSEDDLRRILQRAKELQKLAATGVLSNGEDLEKADSLEELARRIAGI